MGRSRVVPYTVECFAIGHRITPMEWRIRPRYQIPANGQPTAANLAKYIEDLNASFRAGGVNAHCGPIRITSAHIVRQRDKQVMAEWCHAEPITEIRSAN